MELLRHGQQRGFERLDIWRHQHSIHAVHGGLEERGLSDPHGPHDECVVALRETLPQMGELFRAPDERHAAIPEGWPACAPPTFSGGADRPTRNGSNRRRTSSGILTGVPSRSVSTRR